MEQKIVDPYNFERMNDYVNKLVELRSKKGMTPEEAKKLLLMILTSLELCLLEWEMLMEWYLVLHHQLQMF